PAHVIPQTAPADFVPWLVILKPFADGREQAAGLVLDRCKDVGPLLEHGDVLSLAFGDDGVDGGLLVASLKIPDLSADRASRTVRSVQNVGRSTVKARTTYTHVCGTMGRSETGITSTIGSRAVTI